MGILAVLPIAMHNILFINRRSSFVNRCPKFDQGFILEAGVLHVHPIGMSAKMRIGIIVFDIEFDRTPVFPPGCWLQTKYGAVIVRVGFSLRTLAFNKIVGKLSPLMHTICTRACRHFEKDIIAMRQASSCGNICDLLEISAIWFRFDL